MSVSRQAEALAAQGRASEAALLLDRAGLAGDADALFTHAAWLLSGQHLRRDLIRSRELFGSAAKAGNLDAARVHVAFTANGTGGAADWAAACALLSDLAKIDDAARLQVSLIGQMGLEPNGGPAETPVSSLIEATQSVWWVRGLFSLAECAYLIDVAQPFLEPSVVIDPKSGSVMRDPIRTSAAAAFPLAMENPVIFALNKRVAAATRTAVAQGEPLQILHYRPGQEYKLHIDALPPQIANQRAMTVLVYLNADYEGGETEFPTHGLRVRGAVGDGLIFQNVDRDGIPDPAMRHAGRPVLRGNKFIASRWIRAKPLDLLGT